MALQACEGEAETQRLPKGDWKPLSFMIEGKYLYRRSFIRFIASMQSSWVPKAVSRR